MDPLKFFPFATFLLFCIYSIPCVNSTKYTYLNNADKRYILDQINEGQHYWKGPPSSHPKAMEIYNGTMEVIKDMMKETTIYIFHFQSATRGICTGMLTYINNRVGKERGRESYKVLKCEY